MKVVNLAQRPFQNRRPLRRLSATLWAAALAFSLLDLWLFWDHLTGFSTTSGQLTDVRAQIERENEEIERLGGDIAALSLEEQNVEVEVLNEIIADRAFPWGLLFDHLESVLPEKAWLASVSPTRGASRRSNQTKERRAQAARARSSRRRSRATALTTETPNGVSLGLRGLARDSTALFELVDRLFADPVFERPVLRSQSRNQLGQQDFGIDVVFRVDLAQQARRDAVVIADDELETGTAGPTNQPTEVHGGGPLEGPGAAAPSEDENAAESTQTAEAERGAAGTRQRAGRTADQASAQDAAPTVTILPEPAGQSATRFVPRRVPAAEGATRRELAPSPSRDVPTRPRPADELPEPGTDSARSDSARSDNGSEEPAPPVPNASSDARIRRGGR